MVKLFFVINLVLLIFCSLAFIYDFEQFSKTIWFILGLFILPLQLAGIMALKTRQKVKNEKEDAEYHNDFSQVGSGPETPVKPRDYTGNVHLNHQETYQEDMIKMGIDPEKKS